MITTTASATEDPTEVVTKRITILEAVDIIISETTTKIIVIISIAISVIASDVSCAKPIS